MAPRGGGAKFGGGLSKLRILCSKTAFFGPKRPRNPVKTAKRSKTVATLQVRLDFTVSKSALVPFNSTICPRNGPKRRQKAPKSAQCAPARRNHRGHLIHPQPPTFCGFQASESPNETPRPPYQRSLGAAGGQPGPRTVGANGGCTKVPGAKKIIFSKVVPRPLGILKQVFLGSFERILGHGKSQNALKMGCFTTKKGSRMGQKRIFPKVILDHLGCSNKCF